MIADARGMTIGARIRQRREQLGLSQDDMAEKVGVRREAVSQWERDETSPKKSRLRELAEFLRCDMGWLLDGLESHRNRGIDLDESVNATLPLATTIREIDVYVGMGGGGLMDEENPGAAWQFPTDWLKSEIRGNDLDRLRILTLEGDSMAGTLEPGDKVVVDTARCAPSPPGLFVVYDGLALVAKRLEYIEGSEPPRIRIISDNPHYQPYERTTGEVHIAGRIMGRWQRLS